MSKRDDSNDNGRGGYTVGDILGAAITGAAHAVMRLLQSGGRSVMPTTAAPAVPRAPAMPKAAQPRTAKPRRPPADRRAAKPRRSSANHARTP